MVSDESRKNVKRTSLPPDAPASASEEGANLSERQSEKGPLSCACGDIVDSQLQRFFMMDPSVVL